MDVAACCDVLLGVLCSVRSAVLCLRPAAAADVEGGDGDDDDADAAVDAGAVADGVPIRPWLRVARLLPWPCRPPAVSTCCGQPAGSS